MENLSFFEKINKIFFIGISGISLSALAIIMKNLGFDVAGSDLQTSEITEKLLHRGINVKRGHKKKHIKDFKPDLVVYSGAIKEENIELRFARLHNIFCLERSSFIERILPYYNQVISISGTHGKTTTTSMIGEIFINAKLPITLHIGGESTNLESNCKSLGNEYFITEACEYRKSFLKIPSDLGVILNIEEDHLDYYKDIDGTEYGFDVLQFIPQEISDIEYAIIQKHLPHGVISIMEDLLDVFIKDNDSDITLENLKPIIDEYSNRI